MICHGRLHGELRTLPLVLRSQTQGKLARADMQPELARCFLVLLFEHVLREAQSIAGSGIILTVWANDERTGVGQTYRVEFRRKQPRATR